MHNTGILSPYSRKGFSLSVHLIRTASNTLKAPDIQVAKISIIARKAENGHCHVTKITFKLFEISKVQYPTFQVEYALSLKALFTFYAL